MKRGAYQRRKPAKKQKNLVRTGLAKWHGKSRHQAIEESLERMFRK